MGWVAMFFKGFFRETIAPFYKNEGSGLRRSVVDPLG
jgi:hypothetical protein